MKYANSPVSGNHFGMRLSDRSRSQTALKDENDFQLEQLKSKLRASENQVNLLTEKYEFA